MTAPRVARTSIRARVRALPGGRIGWRIGVTVVGVAVILLGVALLPLPGPGWVIIFAGLGVLATEYAWAARLLIWTRDKAREWTRWVGRQPLWLRSVIGLLLLAVVVAAGYAAWRLTR